MLLEFSVGNYRSFRDVVTFNMLAENKDARDEVINLNNTFEYRKNQKLVKSAVIYGANASGKSNLIEAFNFFVRFVISSARESSSLNKINVEPYLLDNDSPDKPSHFEIIFIDKNTRYRYGFEVDKDKVHQEWLYSANLENKTLRESELLWRDLEVFEGNSRAGFKVTKELKSRTNDNTLFLAKADQNSNEIANSIFKWLGSTNVISGIQDANYLHFTTEQFEEDSDMRDKIKELILNIDVGVTDVDAKTIEVEIPESFKRFVEISDVPSDLKEAFVDKESKAYDSLVSLAHPVFDKDKNKVGKIFFDFDDQESEGTKKMFKLSGPIFSTLKRGSVLFIDELDARLHPWLTRVIIRMFNSQEDNPNNAQLIFVTHDTTMLDNTLFRRDQIWFAEKNEYGSTSLYSLSDFNDVRNDSSFGKDYLSGKYGAIPYVGTFQF